MKNLVNYVVDAGVALLTLNDPPLNAYTYEMMKELDEAILEARFDNDVHALVITGAGGRIFCSGANLDMLREVDPAFRYYFSLHAHETLQRLENTPKLVIAAINGHCIGGGFEIALACDLRVAHRGAGKIGLPEVHLGSLPGTGGVQRLTRLLGKSRALEILLEGDTFDMDRAQDLGLVHRTFDASPKEFLDQVIDYAVRFGPPHRPPLTVGRIKRAAQMAGEISLEQGLAVEREMQQALSGTGDAKEGFDAFSEKRPPSFKGR